MQFAPRVVIAGRLADSQYLHPCFFACNKEDAEMWINSWSSMMLVTELICSLLCIFIPEEDRWFLIILFDIPEGLQQYLPYYLLLITVYEGVAPHQSKQQE